MTDKRDTDKPWPVFKLRALSDMSGDISSLEVSWANFNKLCLNSTQVY